MLRHRFDSIGRAPKIAVPLLCLVAADDRIIPAEHSRRLYAAWGDRSSGSNCRAPGTQHGQRARILGEHMEILTH